MRDLISRSALYEDIERRSYISRPLKEIFETIIDDQPKVNEWIPCSERLPEDDVDSYYYPTVNVTTLNGAVKPGFFRCMDYEWYVYYDCSNAFELVDNAEVIAWQPLPEPYDMRKKV